MPPPNNNNDEQPPPSLRALLSSKSSSMRDLMMMNTRLLSGGGGGRGGMLDRSIEEDESVAFSFVGDHDDDDDLTDHDDNGDNDGASTTATTTVVGKRETKAVSGIRVFAALVLIVSTVLVAYLVHHYTSSSERAQFEIQFEEDAHKVLQSVGASFDLTLGAIDALVVSLVSHARATNQTWPYVTIPDFSVRVEKVRTLTHAVYMNLYPYVPYEEREKWEAYSAIHGPEWVLQGMQVQQSDGLFQQALEDLNISASGENITYWDVIHDYNEWDKPEDEMGTVGLDPSDPGPFMPMWQTSPVIPADPPYNWDYLSAPMNESVMTIIETHQVTMSEAYLIAFPDDNESIQENLDEADWISSYITSGEEPMEPISDLFYPILDTAADKINVLHADYEPGDHTLGGFLSASIYWRDMIKGILPNGSNGVLVVFDNPCNPVFTYEINGPMVRFLGEGDHHESKYDNLEMSALLLDLHEYSIRGSAYTGIPVSRDFCPFTLRVYPSSKMESSYITSNRIIYTTMAVLIFAFCVVVFIAYDYIVERRQRVVLQSAVESNAIVSSLFPSTVRARLFNHNASQQSGGGGAGGVVSRSMSTAEMTSAGEESKHVSSSMKGFMDASTNSSRFKRNLPIADLFPDCTVLFADLAGFTAWSSSRDPAQVFILLETLYGAFDSLAKRRGVFKVETIGDCYVAVTGLPEPRRGHAVVMARFAAASRDKMNELTRELELTLGPGTSDLLLRCGLHSGPVTAGVLRGEKSRFQLFGDTVNTAARMESLGTPDLIHVSQKTADLLIASGKKEWIRRRESLVEAKGKGQMQTYWVEPLAGTFESSDHSSTTFAFGSDSIHFTTPSADGSSILFDVNSTTGILCDFGTAADSAERKERLIDWMFGAFEDMIKNLAAQRRASRRISGLTNSKTDGLSKSASSNDLLLAMRDDLAPRVEMWEAHGEIGVSSDSIALEERSYSTPAATVRDELVETIAMAPFNKVEEKVDPEQLVLPETVSQQLRSYITDISNLYRHDNPFHNFEHASHVTMSVVKLFNQINTRRKTLSQQEFYIHSFGVALDPLAQVAMLFAALVHDVDHSGVPNAQLIKEDAVLASRYQSKSVAEQNSVDIAWRLLLEPEYANLRACLFPTSEDARRFRQFVVNAVLATDIFDPELRAIRDKRWVDAFSERARSDDPDALNRKATIVLEHVIQASDVSHTMQHWTVYQRWNSLLFQETYLAYLSGRSEKDPSLGWFEGELAFFDNYIIPLAKKLKECQVFGASSHELLDFAYENRLEWETKGHSIVKELKWKLEQQERMRRKKQQPQLVTRTGHVVVDA